MGKWKYNYSFISGILFILSFFLKELILNSPNDLSIITFVIPFIFMIVYVIGLFLGYLKYSLLNEKKLLKITSMTIMVTYPLIVAIELIDRIVDISMTHPTLIVISKYLLGFSLILFAVALFKQKKIYEKYTIFQGICSLLLGTTFLLSIPGIFIFQLPLFLLLFFSLTYLIKKRSKKNFKSIGGKL